MERTAIPATPRPDLDFPEVFSGFRVHHHIEELCPHVDLVTFSIDSRGAEAACPFSVNWNIPSTDIQATWTPSSGRNKGLSVDWGKGFHSSVTSGAPVVCLHNNSGLNRLTFALSEVLHPVELRAGIHEETGEFFCRAALLTCPSAARQNYKFQLRIDRRAIPYYETLSDVTDWWASLPDCPPSPVPACARLPMYSSWYSFHQDIDPGAIEEQCRLSQAWGCATFIMDDGWQTLDNRRGYAFCGDWNPERIPAMKEHVARVHALGMKYILWYSVPFVGFQSAAALRFAGKFLSSSASKQTHLLDPRFPEVREYLIQTYEKALRAWEVDGFKLDFVDAFVLAEDSPLDAIDGRDLASVSQAVDRLLAQVMARLRQINPEIMIEFRQSYVGPLMRKYGNIFRAGDCPNDGQTNRIAILDLRLLSGNTAVHSDMLMWHPLAPVESAALQILNVIFAVPQISVRIDHLPVDHQKMCRFWLKFWQLHRDCLLDGKLQPLRPQENYPLVIASTPEKWIAVAYAETVIPLTTIPEDCYLLNATGTNRLIIELRQDQGLRQVSSFDTLGRLFKGTLHKLNSGLHQIEVPISGFLQIGSDHSI